MGDRMKRFIEGEDRKQVTLLPECLDDFVAEDNPVRIIEAFVEELELASLAPAGTGRYPAPVDQSVRAADGSVCAALPFRQTPAAARRRSAP